MSLPQAPTISVLMPCRDGAATVAECLSSIAAQTFPDFELVVVDDGSTDDTPAILAAWAAREARIRVIRQEHGGIVKALQTGLAVCRGKYVARMDADDRADPRRLALQAVHLDAHPQVGVVGCLVRAFPEEDVRGGFRVYLDWLNGLVTHEQICREIFVESPLPHPSVMFRRALVSGLGGYRDEGWAEDYDLWLRLYLAGCRFEKVPAVLVEWREHPGRLTRTDSRYALENFLRAKAYYLVRGPLVGRDAVVLWGAGMMGRRLGRQLLRAGAPVTCFVDVDLRKIGRTRHGRPVIAPDELLLELKRHQAPIVLAAVGARGARGLIRQRLDALGLQEGVDWLAAA